MIRSQLDDLRRRLELLQVRLKVLPDGVYGITRDKGGLRAIFNIIWIDTDGGKRATQILAVSRADAESRLASLRHTWHNSGPTGDTHDDERAFRIAYAGGSVEIWARDEQHLRAQMAALSRTGRIEEAWIVLGQVRERT